MSFLNPAPHRRVPAGGLRPDRCLNCFGTWPCAEERQRRALADKVPTWSTQDELNLGARVRRLRR